METKPTARYINHEWHWLWGVRASSPVCCQWLWTDMWYCTGESRAISPEEMYRRGWRWYAPAIPPKIPIDINESEEDLDYIPR